MPDKQVPIDEERIKKWNEDLRRYHDGKRKIESRIRANEEFWRVRQWKYITGENGENNDTPSTAWLWTCIQSKLADVMDSYPTANFRARQRDDKEEAKRLSSVVPVILEQNNFEAIYHDVSEYALKNGTGAYGIFWDGTKHNGLGDISVEKVDIFNLFFEAGITDIQRSKSVFYVKLEDNKAIEQRYPQAVGHLKKSIELSKYIYNEGRIDYTDKSPVIDVYYHVHTEDARRILHFAKYVGDVILFATENEPDKYPNGWYDHGMYPFELQPLYHMEGTAYGMGIVDVAKDTQLSIDLINEAMLKNTLMGSSPRYFIQKASGINREQFLDWREPFVEVNSVDDHVIRGVEITGLSGNYMSFLQNKIEEIKYITSNQDVNNGSTPSGVTAASALAALQETAGRNSRMINKTLYRGYRRVVSQVVELIRQFYDIPRQFRIIPDEMGQGEQFTQYDNSRLKPQPNPSIMGRDMGLRKPEFDIEITAEKANPYRKMEINELAINFYQLGFFNPQMCDQALATLEMMDFDHKADIVNRVQLNGSLLQKVQELQTLVLGMAQRYGDTAALQMVQQSMIQTGQAMPGVTVNAADAARGGDTGEAAHVEKARAQARASTEAQ